MDITSIKLIEKETKIEKTSNGIRVFVPNNWIITGEDRLSYTTIIRLIECCREYHWYKDISSKCPTCDSICVDLSVKFYKPISPSQCIFIKYKVIHIGNKSYTLAFDVINENEVYCASARIVSAFYDPDKQISIPIPDNISMNAL